MRQIEDRYISLLTDFGFNRIFGTALNKELLICFLNSLFDGKQVVRDVKYLNNEHLGDVYVAHKAISDVYCEGENGEKFIVEMQNVYQEFCNDRSLFDSTFPIREQAVKGSDWDFRLSHVYMVSFLNTDMKEKAFDPDAICHYVKLCDTTTHKVFYEKLDFIYVEIAKFEKSEEELVTLYDKWLYVLKNLSTLTNRPKALRDKVFDRLFEEAEIARFSPRELREYEDSLKAYRDLKNSFDTALRQGYARGFEEGLAEGLAEVRAKGLEEGFAKGLEEVRKSVAQKMKSMGMTVESICQVTDLTAEQILSL